MMLLNFIRKKKWMIFSTAAVIIAVSAFVILVAPAHSTTFYKGVQVEGINLWKLELSEAKSLAEARIQEMYPQKELKLAYKNQTWILKLEDIDFKYNTDSAVDLAYRKAMPANFFERVRQAWKLRSSTLNIPVKCSYDINKLNRIVYSLKKNIDLQEKNAAVSYKNNTLTVSREAMGRKINVDENVKLVQNSFEKKNFDTVNLVVEDIPPRITYDDVIKADFELGSFSTTFNTGDTDRTHNIRLACERINNTVLLPGDVFSMDTMLGPRTVENGYREAPVILKNDITQGTGGGVCQVTTTLYNAVLKSRLKVTERAHHSMPLGYVGPGLDATIAEGYIDFKFQNDTEYALFVNAEVRENMLQVRIIGKKPNSDITVKLRNEVVAELLPEGEEIIQDSAVPFGEKQLVRQGQNGLKVIVYRESYNENRELVKTEKLTEDYYSPVKPQYKVNPEYIRSLNK